MERTEQITLGGCNFYIGESAYEKLKGYIERLKRHFANTEGGAEIVADMEIRLAEIFYEKTNGGKMSITQEMVEMAMRCMGDPDNGFEESSAEADYSGGDVDFMSLKRKLYRDSERGIVGGVCVGLSAYLKVDVVLVRLAFLLFAGVLLYLILWVVMKDAVTPVLRRRMEGVHKGIDGFWGKFDELLDKVTAKVQSLDMVRRVLLFAGVALAVWLFKSSVISVVAVTVLTWFLSRTKSRSRRVLLIVLIIFALVLRFDVCHFHNHYGVTFNNWTI